MTNKPSATEKQSQDDSLKEITRILYGVDSLTAGMLDEICHLVDQMETRMHNVHAKNEDTVNPTQFSVCVAISTAMVLAHLDQTYKKDQGKDSEIISVIQHGYDTMMTIASDASSSTEH